MANTEDLRPSKRPAHAGRLPVPVLVAVVLAVLAAAVFVAGSTLRRDAEPQTASFLNEALGLPQPDAPRIRQPATDIRVDLEDGLVVDRAGARVRLTAEGVTGPWERFADGVRRPVPFGHETIVQKGAFAEHLLEVTERQGRKTWRWQLDTTLDLDLKDGEVLFSRKGVDVGYRIFPVQVFDGAGKVVTPAGAAWALDRSGRTPVLELALDDAALPLPYVIDPPVAFVRQLGSAANKTASTTLSFTTTAASTVGDSVFLAVASDNITGGACITATYGGTALTQDSAVINDPSAGNGARATLFSGHNFPAKANGSTVARQLLPEQLHDDSDDRRQGRAPVRVLGTAQGRHARPDERRQRRHRLRHGGHLVDSDDDLARRAADRRRRGRGSRPATRSPRAPASRPAPQPARRATRPRAT